MSKKELVEFSDEWLIHIVKVAKEIFGDCIYIESDKHPCGWDFLSFEDVEVDEVLEYKFDICDITGYVYDEHKWEDKTLKQILQSGSPKWGFEGIN